MYANFFGLHELPFDLTPNPRYLVLMPRHREVLSTLQYGLLGRKGITLLVGEAGTGKTTLMRAAMASEALRKINCVYLNNPMLTRDEFLEFLAQGFGLGSAAGASKAVLLRELERALVTNRRVGLVSALVVDECQSMPHELLEEIRLLANIETDTDKLLPVVLAGQPELNDRLNEPALRQLKQRIALRCELAPLDIDQTARYIADRLRIAGGDHRNIFAREAAIEVHQRSGGIPRTISVICDNALLGAFALGTRMVTLEIVRDVCRDLDLAPAGAGHAVWNSDVGGAGAFGARRAAPEPREIPPVAVEAEPMAVGAEKELLLRAPVPVKPEPPKPEPPKPPPPAAPAAAQSDSMFGAFAKVRRRFFVF